MNYYNDNEAFIVKWLKELIKEKLIPDGDVDDRPMQEIKPNDLASYTQCHFFAGIGGWPYALQLSGWNADRPIWTGSCPCQPLSVAGKGLGEKDSRHVWPAWYELIRQLRPPTIFGEQVASKDGREWLAGVRLDLEAVGYAVGAADLPAASVGAPHKRNRLFWVGVSNGPEPFKGNQTGKGSRYGHTVEPTGFRVGADEQTGWESGKWEQEKSPANGVADNPGARLEGTTRSSIQGRSNRSTSGGFWSNSIAILCADGKARRVPGRVAHTKRGGWSTGSNPGESGGVEGRCQEDRQQWKQSRVGVGSRMSINKKRCEKCKKFFSKFQCSANLYGECDCPKCQGLCECETIKSEIKSGFLLLSDGFLYGMANVYAELITQAIKEIKNHAETTGLNANEVVSMVQETYGKKEVQSEEKQKREDWEIGRQGGISEKEMLFTFMRDISSALNGTAIGGSGQEESAKDDRGTLRDLRRHIENLCSSLRQQSEKQQIEKPSNSLLTLSQFLAQCSEACRDYYARSNAVSFPLAGYFMGRVGALRGAGNAIVPQVAAEFIKAFMEVA